MPLPPILQAILLLAALGAMVLLGDRMLRALKTAVSRTPAGGFIT